MTGPPLHLEDVDISSEASASLLIQVLSDEKHALPESLSVLGSIVNSFDRTRPLSVDNHPTVQAWCTESLANLQAQISDGVSARPLFSVFTFEPSTQQFRYFCSAEVAPGDKSKFPTPDENTHVAGAFRALRALADAHYPRFHVLKPNNSDDPPQIVIGAVHEKWRTATEPIILSRNPCPRYLLSPDNAKRSRSNTNPQLHPQSSPTLYEQDWIVSQMLEHDIPTVSSTSHIPRSATYLRSRFPYSVCLRDPSGPVAVSSSGADAEADADPTKRRAIAWALIHSDGGVGTLYVDTRYRGRRLGKRVVSELGRMLDPGAVTTTTSGCPLADGDPGGGAAGWVWAETMQSNAKGQAFFDSLGSEGWERAWTCDWVRIGRVEQE
ncbi:hypothetical protein CONPUDRAFT_152242 [Coniophora puteana RWD-64-598 SS2]|uniref:Uncharacterized protein n=1 Tax=Coniophora puteana (strain RWD-64-598) TaxID=741705 RepID=A0A5M3MVP9_CONPW|nr:uncharacterized protein CONPUDRAFT_152242 [Coniophora puteana RWD-64-598 SS2]EIW83206.1 hypothetical protein CONPUDRAFT_152242 [Coniophora puteana RWD-64-598 SS2]